MVLVTFFLSPPQVSKPFAYFAFVLHAYFAWHLFETVLYSYKTRRAGGCRGQNCTHSARQEATNAKTATTLPVSGQRSLRPHPLPQAGPTPITQSCRNFMHIKDDFQSVLHIFSTLMFLNIKKVSLDGMQVNVIRYERYTLSLRPFNFF